MTENRQGSRSGQSSSFSKSLRIEVSSILLFALSVFAICALISYAPADPSWFSNNHGPAHNACGRVGANLSALLLQWFGLGAFLFPASVFFIAMNVWRREGMTRLIGMLGGMTVAVISAAVFLTLQWKFWPFAGNLILTGGAFGAWVADLLVRQFNPFGSSIVSLLVFCLAVALSTPVSVARVGAWILGLAGRLAGRTTKLIWTYLLFVLGLVAMKLVNVVGDLLQKGLSKSLEKAKEARGRASKPNGSERSAKGAKADKAKAAFDESDDEDGEKNEEENGKSEDDEDEVEKSAGSPAASPSVEPIIGLDPPVSPKVARAAKAARDAQEPDRGRHGKETKGEDVAEGPSGNLDNLTEAPNALPELERRVRPAGAASARKSSEPAILPHEKQPPSGATLAPLDPEDEGEQKSGIVTSELASKVASKLARAASRTSRRGNWQLPTVEFLRKVPKIESSVDKDKLLANAQMLKQKFADFDIEGEVTAVRPGPVITLYEFKPGPGIKVSRIASMADDLAMALSAQSVRILAPLPGKSVVGIEIPSENREMVFLREFLQHPDFYGSKHAIPVIMGKDIAGQPYLSDLARMPHLLCAGQTGSGKSVFMNGLICSLLYRFTPDELRLIMIDPKTVEFRAYHDIPHLLLPVVEDPAPASIALRWAVREMDRRYRIMARTNARNLASFNQKIDEMGVDVVRDLLFAEENSESPSTAPAAGSDWIEAFEPDESGAPRVGKLPYIIIIIDELADLMMTAKKEVEISIARIAQKARAAGIHLVIATQRPSTDVITGLIKANLPSRCSFQLSSYIDSKTILDRAGAERLLGHGDMLFIPPGVSNTLRLHGAYVDDEEISKITSFLKAQGKPSYRDEILLEGAEDEEGEDGEGDQDTDALFNEAVELVKRSGHASASFLQRHLKVGYNRAARMIETMEAKGIVGPADGARPREVLLR